jgi:membrane protein DedA with SNARE-associated domain
VVEAWALALAASPWIFLVVFLLAAVDGFFPPIPSESVVIGLAALGMSQGTPNMWLLVLVAALGAFTGDQLAYQIGSRVTGRGPRLLRSGRARSGVRRAEDVLARRGAAFIIAARFVPVARVAVNMTAGAVGYPRRRFVGLAAIASASWAAYAALIGIGAGAWFGSHMMLGIVVGVVGGVAIGVLVDQVLRRVTDLASARRGPAPVPAERELVGAGSGAREES